MKGSGRFLVLSRHSLFSDRVSRVVVGRFDYGSGCVYFGFDFSNWGVVLCDRVSGTSPDRQVNCSPKFKWF